ARAGTVHPYFKAEEPLVCEGWLTSDSQTVAYQVTDARDVVFLPFLDAAADACRGAQGQLGRMPLAMKAVANMRLVERELVKDPAEIERLLRAARRAADDFKGTDNFRTLAFGDSDDLKLTALIRKHGVHTGEGPALIDRSLWFTQAYIGSETAIRSIVYSLPEYWTPLAAGETGASSEEVAKARSQFTSYVLQLKRQGTEAGLEAETEAMLREAVTAFHKGEIIPPEAATTKPMMPWLYDMIIRLLTPAPAAE
ncbi:MAG: hypothetical protein Q8S09_15160, partial [Hyphomonas sp.]|nr:hypothetical protein [Hyphomonas sp.]